MKTLASFLMLVLIGTTVWGQKLPDPKQPVKQTTKETSKVLEDYPLDLKKVGLKLPEVTDPQLRQIFNNSNTVFYKLPQVWQHWIPGSRIERNNLTLNEKSYVYEPYIWGIYFSDYLPEFNANKLFPWETTVGLNTSIKETNAYRTVNFLSLPEEHGKPIPVLVLNELPIKWIFPPGTTVGEIIYVVYEGQRYVQEIRTRTKMADSSAWEPAVHRPIRNRTEYVSLTGVDYTPAYKHMFFRNPQEDEVFKMEGLVERLPAQTPDKVKRLLDRPFHKLSNEEIWSPAAEQEFHVLPKDYCFALVGSIDSFTCANCHRQTQASHRHMIPKEPLIINNPRKVGSVRGCDNVFTWSPIDSSSVRHSDQEAVPPLKLRNYDLSNNLVSVHNTANTTTETSTQRYKLTSFVENSLKSYELPAKQFLHDLEKKSVNPNVNTVP